MSFNDREVWTSPDGFAIKAMIDTASNYEIWYPVAGNTRGVVSALDTKVHFTDGDQDLLYDNGVNPIIFDAGQGIKIWGQKTLLSQPSKIRPYSCSLVTYHYWSSIQLKP